VGSKYRKWKEAALLLKATRTGHEAAAEEFRVTGNKYKEQAALIKDLLQAQARSTETERQRNSQRRVLQRTLRRALCPAIQGPCRSRSTECCGKNEVQQKVPGIVLCRHETGKNRKRAPGGGVSAKT
jgi:hypothetical protein